MARVRAGSRRARADRVLAALRSDRSPLRSGARRRALARALADGGGGFQIAIEARLGIIVIALHFGAVAGNDRNGDAAAGGAIAAEKTFGGREGHHGAAEIGAAAFRIGDARHFEGRLFGGVRALTKRNPNYWNPDRGFVDTVETLAINDPTARLAALQSGSLVTARLAVAQGRDVFAIPGSIHSPLSKGCHALIKEGAKLVESVHDILEELHWHTTAKVDEAIATAADDLLLELMGFEPVSLNALEQATGLTVSVLSAALLQLEMNGLVSTLPGGLYQRLL